MLAIKDQVKTSFEVWQKSKRFAKPFLLDHNPKPH